MEKIQVEIVGLSSSQLSNGAFALILKEVSGDRRIPIIIGAFEAQAIALEMEGIHPPRPLTHDLIKSILDTLGSEVTEVCITELRDGTFYASIVLSSGGQEIDARPSDAIALAVRVEAPIYVSDIVMAEASFIPEDEGAQTAEGGDLPSEPVEEEREAVDPTSPVALEQQLKDAITREDYEKAATLRDTLEKMKKKTKKK